jgi:hypothetical protein
LSVEGQTQLKAKLILHALVILLLVLSANAQKPDGNAVPVTVINFVRAESDMYLGNMVREGSLGKFSHRREPASIDNRPAARPNRDTLYSAAVFDLDAGPVTITLPDTGQRLVSMQVINEDHYLPMVVYGGGVYTLDKTKVETRYVATVVRIVVDPADTKDIQQGRTLQDAIKVEQVNPGNFEMPNWDQDSQKRMRDAILILASSISDLNKAFGAKDQVDPIQHLAATAINWGGYPNKDAIYRNITPGKNDGTTISKLVVKDVPVDAFWSLGVYGVKDFVDPNRDYASSISSLTAKKNSDGAIAIQFGGCDGKIPNCLSISPGWGYMIRLYRPRQEILDGKWSFPPAQPAH